MKIGIDLRPLQTGSQYRGIGHYTYNLVKMLCKIDSFNEYIFFVNKNNGHEEFHLLDKLIKETGKKVISLPVARRQEWNWKRQWEALSSPIFFNLAGIDILHVTSLFESEAFVSIPPISGKIIVTMYDLIPLIFRNYYLDRTPIEWQTHYIESLDMVKKYTDGIFAISECTKIDSMKLLDYPEEKIEVVYGGISDFFYIVDDDDLLHKTKNKYGIQEKFILYTAAEDPRKNYDIVIKAFDILQNEYNDRCQLVLVGRASSEWKERMINLCVSLGIKKGSLVFTGYIDDAELNLLYNAASLFIFPSLYEGFGLPILEAMSCGTPVISANNSSLPEVCGDAAIMVDATDSKELAQKINKVLSSPALQAELREKGFENIKRFSWAKAAEKTLSFYKRIVRGTVQYESMANKSRD